jgi:hypothetical protein
MAEYDPYEQGRCHPITDLITSPHERIGVIPAPRMTPLLADHRHGHGPGARVESGIEIVSRAERLVRPPPLVGSKAFSIGAHGR